ncbi:MAG: hypothetical protein AAF439_06025 [Pseudomonadota bacterium]
MIIALLTACAGDPGPPPLRERISGTAAPTAALRDSILTQTNAYWLAMNEGRLDDAFAFHTEDYQERLSMPAWRQKLPIASAEPPRPVSIHWTQAARRQDGPELYAIVDWTGQSGETGSEGRLIWRQDYDGVFRLENAEQRLFLLPGSG